MVLFSAKIDDISTRLYSIMKLNASDKTVVLKLINEDCSCWCQKLCSKVCIIHCVS